MKKSEFPEKAFEIFINHFLLEKGFALYIPSQAKEAKVAYDALIKNLITKNGKIIPLALQYKIVSEYEVQKVARNFKFDLHVSIDNKTKKAKYNQHNILCKKNKSSKYFAAGYIVPYFVTYKALYENINNDTLLNNSYLIKPQHRISDTKYHYYTFDKNHALQHSSESLDVEIQPLGKLLEQIGNTSKDLAVPIQSFIAEFTNILEIDKIENMVDISEEYTKNVYPIIAYKLF